MKLFTTILLVSVFTLFCQQDSTFFKTEAAVLETEKGNITITFFDVDAPIHVANFKEKCRSGFYNEQTFNRVIENFVIQTGRTDNILELIDPEIKKIHFRGAVGAARKDDSVNPERRSDPTEFYITIRPKPELDGKYTIFGRVAEGMDVVEKISKVKTGKNDTPLEQVKINKVYIIKYFDKERYEWEKRQLNIVN